MGQPGGSTDVGPQAFPVLSQADTQERCPHGWAITCGPAPAAGRREAQPESGRGTLSGPGGAGGDPEQPPAQLPGRRVSKGAGIPRSPEEGLRHQAGMLGIIADHAVSEQPAVAQRRAPKELSCSPAGEALAGRSKASPTAIPRSTLASLFVKSRPGGKWWKEVTNEVQVAAIRIGRERGLSEYRQRSNWNSKTWSLRLTV